jgi:hypothetical protein
MSADPQGQPEAPSRRAKRSYRYVLAAGIMVTGLGLLAYQFLWPMGEEGRGPIGRVVFPIKRKPAPAKLGIEYHFDRNAVVDSRLVASKILGLTASGNLIVLDAESFALRNEKVLARRATCLGPVEGDQVLVGIANGCIVRVALGTLAFERVDDVPGVPRWIGKTAKTDKLVIAYQPDPGNGSSVWLKVEGHDQPYEIGVRPTFYRDGSDRLWVASGDRVFFVNLATLARTDFEWKGGWQGVRGFTELGDGQVWAFGGIRRGNDLASFVTRLLPGKPTLLYPSGGKHPPPSAPLAPITHVLADDAGTQVLVVAPDGAALTDRSLAKWQPLDAMGGGRRDDDALAALGQAHHTGRGLLLALARGGFMHVTSEFTRRHLLEGQNPVSRPLEIVRLEKGIAFFGDGGPSFYAGGTWRALPDPVVPPAELMGTARAGESERVWAAMLTIPLPGETSYVIAKAGAPRHYLGHIHGLRDTFLTGRWDGKALTVLGREDLPIEPADTFTTPDNLLWNVDDQGLWSFSGGHWRMVMRATAGPAQGAGPAGTPSAASSHTAFKSAIGEPLHFASSTVPPFYGLPSSGSSWALVRLDSNEEGGVPLIDEVPVLVDGRRALVHDLTTWENKRDELLLATDHGLCVFHTKWGTCNPGRPASLAGEVSLFKRDSARRLWLGGRGLWVLRDLKHAAAVSPSIPMLGDTRVVAMAEAADGRLVVGLEDRGTVFVSLPEGWLDRPPELPGVPAAWESARPHEPSYQEVGIVLRECRDKGGQLSDAGVTALLGDLRALARTVDPRVRVGTEAVFDGRPDIVVAGTEPERLLAGVTAALGKHAGKARFAVWQRQGARGSETVPVRMCAQP